MVDLLRQYIFGHSYVLLFSFHIKPYASGEMAPGAVSQMVQSSTSVRQYQYIVPDIMNFHIQLPIVLWQL